MTSELGFKELYEVTIKSTLPIEVGQTLLEKGETVALFDSIQIANFQEIKNIASANGGWDNRAHVYWESTKELKVNFTQGIFSKIQLALMSNAKLISSAEKQVLLIPARETLESDDAGKLLLKHIPQAPIFVYDDITGKKITNWSINDNILLINDAYKTVVVDYQYIYDNSSVTLAVGTPLIQGYLSLTGKMRVKDDITGKVKTGIIKIPKLKLMSVPMYFGQIQR